MSSDDGQRDDNRDDEDVLYAGGEKSGLALQPSNSANPVSDLVKGILSQAASSGSASHSSAKSKKKPLTFTGKGNRLGDSASTADTSADTTAAAKESDDQQDQPPQQRTLTFWADGFSVEDGPLLRYDDLNNQALLEQIKSGQAPISLLNVLPNQPVEVKVAHRLQEKYTPPRKKGPPAFSGSGNRLGGITSSSTPGSFPADDSSSNQTAATSSTRPTYSLDETQPIIAIQVRLGDGTRLKARFNQSHTTVQLYDFINAARNETRAWQVVSGMPPVIIEKSDKKRLDEFANAVVVQRYL